MSKTKAPAYSKEQLLRSKRYTPQQKDILAAVLAEGRVYTHEEAAQAMTEFLKRKVNG